MIDKPTDMYIIAQTLEEIADIERDWGDAQLEFHYRERAADIRAIANKAARREAVCPECGAPAGAVCKKPTCPQLGFVPANGQPELYKPDAPPRPADDVLHDLWVSAINAYDTNRQTGHCDAIKAVVAHVLASTKAEQAHG